MSDPTDTRAVDEIGFFADAYIIRAIATQRQIAWCLARYYEVLTPLGEELISENRARREGPKSKRRRHSSPAGKGQAAEAAALTIRGSQRTGKFTELAMKHSPWARSCSASATAASLSGVMVTTGRSVTSVKRPLRGASAMRPSAASS